MRSRSEGTPLEKLRRADSSRKGSPQPSFYFAPSEAKALSEEHQRLLESEKRQADWKNVGPYVSERAWGSVREDYSANGAAWTFFPHEHSRSRAFRWSEDGIAGICNRHQNVVLSLALWNGRDPILKERLFGLGGDEGNHGEDVKELYFYVDNTPTHSYMKMRYFYPFEYPYAALVAENARRTRKDPEAELWEVYGEERWKKGEFWDVQIEYAKVSQDEILCRVRATNASNFAQELHIVPQLFFRNTWSWGYEDKKPRISEMDSESPRVINAAAQDRHLGDMRWSVCVPASSQGYLAQPLELLLTHNETNFKRLYEGVENIPLGSTHTKDAFHTHITGDNAFGRPGSVATVLPPNVPGTKAAVWTVQEVAPHATAEVWTRFSLDSLHAGGGGEQASGTGAEAAAEGSPAAAPPPRPTAPAAAAPAGLPAGLPAAGSTRLGGSGRHLIGDPLIERPNEDSLDGDEEGEEDEEERRMRLNDSGLTPGGWASDDGGSVSSRRQGLGGSETGSVGLRLEGDFLLDPDSAAAAAEHGMEAMSFTDTAGSRKSSGGTAPILQVVPSLQSGSNVFAGGAAAAPDSSTSLSAGHASSSHLRVDAIGEGASGEAAGKANGGARYLSGSTTARETSSTSAALRLLQPAQQRQQQYPHPTASNRRQSGGVMRPLGAVPVSHRASYDEDFSSVFNIPMDSTASGTSAYDPRLRASLQTVKSNAVYTTPPFDRRAGPAPHLIGSAPPSPASSVASSPPRAASSLASDSAAAAPLNRVLSHVSDGHHGDFFGAMSMSSLMGQEAVLSTPGPHRGRGGAGGGSSRWSTGKIAGARAHGALGPLGFGDFKAVLRTRQEEADAFYEAVCPPGLQPDERRIQRQAFAGLLWSKQYYHYGVEMWLEGDPAFPKPPAERLTGRNAHWRHFYANDVLSMPDKWEYDWFAGWDLGFHMLPLAIIDPEWAKRQLTILLREWYMHPDGAIPAYEWSFSDSNPPVHAWACWRVYQISRKVTGERDLVFLERVFHKLLLNFSYWANRKDSKGNNLFEGGFLGLDNISIFDRSTLEGLAGGASLEQADSTAWMAMYCLDMLTIALELAQYNHVYEDISSKFLEHFITIASSINPVPGDSSVSGLYDEADCFFYDYLRDPDGSRRPVKIKSFVGLIPLFAVATIDEAVLKRLPGFAARMNWFLKHRRAKIERHHTAPLPPPSPSTTPTPVAGAPLDGAAAGFDFSLPGGAAAGAGAPPAAAESGRLRGTGCRLLSVCTKEQVAGLLRRVLNEAEFLSPYGVRSLSKEHEKSPYSFSHGSFHATMRYEAAESEANVMGGNSSWRGPIWTPTNFMLIEKLQVLDHYYGDSFQVECPTGSGDSMPLWDVAHELSQRIINIFRVNPATGQRPVNGANAFFSKDPRFADLVPFFEYFNGDNGTGLGASHQTGWTALVGKLLQQVGSGGNGPNSVAPHGQG